MANADNATKPASIFLALMGAFYLTFGSQEAGFAQYQAPSTLQGKVIVIPIGTTFEGRIDNTIGSCVSRQGERFVISMSSPILANGTEVLIPAGSEVIGEVVEAIPSNKVPKQKNEFKPIGKLRVELTALKTPDGLTFPLVASIVPDQSKMGQMAMAQSHPLGTGVAYVGSNSSFEAVAPGNPRYTRTRPGQAPKVLAPGEIMRDPILGRDQSYFNGGGQNGAMIRSLVRKKNDLYIYGGSPISMRIDAPFKISVASSQGTASTLNAPLQNPETPPAGGRRFSKDGYGRPPIPADNQGNAAASQNAPQLNQPAGKRDPNDSEF